MSNSFNPDPGRHSASVDPDPDSNCLQRLSVYKALNTKQFADTFWLKPWLKLISFGSNFFFHLAIVLATTNSEPV